MKQFYSLILILLIPFSTLLSQEVAMDFTETSCNGTEHHLFAELDQGKVIVLEFVMLNCSPCIVGTNAMVDITETFESVYPGRVKLYSYGFLDIYTCAQILSWQSINSYSHETFSQGEEQVSYYGGMGMPTIVVLGTTNHKVFYKTIGYTPAVDAPLKAAIESALTESSLGLEYPELNDNFKIYPTLFNDKLYLEAGDILNGSVIDLYNASGHKVISEIISPYNNKTLETASLPKGIYFLRLNSTDADKSIISKTIKLIKN
ncbi:MAG TPA: T9SS type A sorting domain-containing protein [Lentimicrobium sp.]|nr:T9SS type A sorting domain-containing protein [Lentimicrobium sp.]